MRVGIPCERTPGERRVAAVPDVVSRYRDRGWEVVVETGAGAGAGLPDERYVDAGAVIGDAYDTDLVLIVGPPSPDTVDRVRHGAAIAGFLAPFTAADVMSTVVDGRLTALALEAVPRSTLAQSMDALSSQANIGGYAAVLLAAGASPRLLPMMVTAAGTIPPAKVVVLGVGVAGLQAIATARRLGAVVHAYDIRPETREQVESLGAKFISAVTGETGDDGYAREVGADTQEEQHAALAPHLADADLVVTTAQIPGRPAPLLVTDEMVAGMRAGAVIVDMAAASGGNVPVSRPDEVVTVGGVTVHGPTNLPAAHPVDASRMYARNLLALLERVGHPHDDGGDGGADGDDGPEVPHGSEDERENGDGDGGLRIDPDDDILGACAVVIGGRPRHPRTVELLGGDG